MTHYYLGEIITVENVWRMDAFEREIRTKLAFNVNVKQANRTMQSSNSELKTNDKMIANDLRKYKTIGIGAGLTSIV